MAKIKHDFTKEDPWRVFKILGEFVEGFDTFKDVDRAVAVFGSSRTKRNTKYYKLAEKTARLFAKEGYAVITGAGPGIMEAANKGAKEGGGESIGLNIIIPDKQSANPYTTELVEFKYFFTRKVMFAKYSRAGIFFPGGFGTFDEFFEFITLVQTERVRPFPIIVMGSTYWQGLFEWIDKVVVPAGAIPKKDLGYFTIADSPEEAVKMVRDFYKEEK
ncbi:MAG: TIGR00730 family Rossman fold protein [Candidatus Omnitrophica bacterium]|nr:TIGR00730 family Rossman fold protein [Candidatus Omnitrophota bacterium]